MLLAVPTAVLYTYELAQPLPPLNTSFTTGDPRCSSIQSAAAATPALGLLLALWATWEDLHACMAHGVVRRVSRHVLKLCLRLAR